LGASGVFGGVTPVGIAPATIDAVDVKGILT
jgi:hypothetical protein